MILFKRQAHVPRQFCVVAVCVLALRMLGTDVAAQQINVTITLTPEQLARALVNRMRLDQKVAQLNTNAPAIPELNLPAFQYWEEALHGYVTQNQTGATVFPVPLAMGATFDAPLIKEVASMISDETRAYNNLAWSQTGGPRALNLFTPNINIYRDPRWGRGHEVYSEDPLHTGRMAVAYVQGLQGDDPTFLKAVATCKHYAAYSMEAADGFTRHNFNAMVSRRDLEETYFPAFEACVREGRAASIMCSYNSVNTLPSCANAALLNDTLRTRWNFTGFVVSDCGAVTDVFEGHRKHNSLEAAVAATTNAGTDLNCDSASTSLTAAVINNFVSEEVVSRALTRVMTQRFRLGGRNNPWSDLPMSIVGNESHIAKAREVGRKSVVLLKNEPRVAGEPPILPINPASLNRVAVIGPLANNLRAQMGSYAGIPAGRGSNATLLTYLSQAIGSSKVVYEPGIAAITSSSADGSHRATQACANSNLCIVVVGAAAGGTPWTEGEGQDRSSLRLTGLQEQLVQAAARANVPTVLVLMNGGPLDISPLLRLPNILAVLVAWFPAQGVQGVADVIVGTVSPSGRLPVTFYFDNYTRQIDMSNMEMRGMPGRTYRYVQVPVLYPFGHGLSYTTFLYRITDWRAVTPDNNGGTAEDVNAYTLQFNVTNVGMVTSDEVVMIYVMRNDTASRRAGLPRRQLLDFRRINLRPNEFAIINFQATRTLDFTFVDERGVRRLWPGQAWIQIAQDSSAVLAEVRVQSVEGVQNWDVANFTGSRLEVIQQGFPEPPAPPPAPIEAEESSAASRLGSGGRAACMLCALLMAWALV